MTPFLSLPPQGAATDLACAARLGAVVNDHLNELSVHGRAAGWRGAVACGHAAVGQAPPLWPEESVAGMAPARAAEFQAGRAAARVAMGRLGGAPAALPRGARGAPLWPEGLVGAITHTGGTALAVCARGLRGVGLDLEPARALDPGVLRAITRPGDRVAGAPFDSGLALFCAKEAAFKAQAALEPCARFAFEIEVTLQGADFFARVTPQAPPISGRILYHFDHLIALAWLADGAGWAASSTTHCKAF